MEPGAESFPGIVTDDGDLGELFRKSHVTVTNPPEGVTHAVWNTFRLVAGVAFAGEAGGNTGDDLEFEFIRRIGTHMQNALRKAAGLGQRDNTEPKKDALEFLQACSVKMGEFGMPEEDAVAGWEAVVTWMQKSR